MAPARAFDQRGWPRETGAGARLRRILALEAALAAVVGMSALVSAYGGRPTGEVAGALSTGTRAPLPLPAPAPGAR